MGKLSHYKMLKSCQRQFAKLTSDKEYEDEVRMLTALLEAMPSKPWIVLTGGSQCLYIAKSLARWLGRTRDFSKLSHWKKIFLRAEKSPNKPHFLIINGMQKLSCQKELKQFAQAFSDGFYQLKGEQKELPQNVFVIAVASSFSDWIPKAYSIPSEVLAVATVVACNNIDHEVLIKEKGDVIDHYYYEEPTHYQTLHHKLADLKQILQIDLLAKTATLDRELCKQWV